MNRSTVRKARRSRSCGSCQRRIEAGSYYVEHVCSPAWEFSGGVWCRMAECSECATRYGRGPLIEARAS